MGEPRAHLRQKERELCIGHFAGRHREFAMANRAETTDVANDL